MTVVPASQFAQELQSSSSVCNPTDSLPPHHCPVSAEFHASSSDAGADSAATLTPSVP